MKTSVNVRLPAPLPAEIPCPVCRREQGKKGSGCIACEFSGKLNLTVDAKIPIQRAHIIKYVNDHMSVVASELTRLYGLIPEIETTEVIDSDLGQYEIVQISSLGGVVWIANRLDDFDSPKYFFNQKDLKVFKEGMIRER